MVKYKERLLVPFDVISNKIAFQAMCEVALELGFIETAGPTPSPDIARYVATLMREKDRIFTRLMGPQKK